jgi:hypothetical protein
MSIEVWKRVVVGDDTGLLKEVAFSPDDFDVAPRLLRTWGTQAKESAISRISVTNESLVTYLRGVQDIELFDTIDGKLLTSFHVPESLGLIKSYRIFDDLCITLVTSLGYLLVISEWIKGNSEKFTQSRLPVERVDCAIWCEEDKGWLVSNDLSPNPHFIREGKVEWTGKNQPDTHLGVTAKFKSTSLLCAGKLFIAGDIEGQIRVYNRHVQRKATFEIKNVFKNTSNHNHASECTARTRPINCLTLLDENTILCADTMGTLVAVGLDTKVVRHGFRGIMGSIRDVKLDGDELYAVSAGRCLYKLDAFRHRQAPAKIFLKQKLTSVCVMSDVEVEIEEKPSKKQRTGGKEDEGDDDEDTKGCEEESGESDSENEYPDVDGEEDSGNESED